MGTGAIVGTDNATISLMGGTVAVGDVTSIAGINITSSQGKLTAGTVSSRSTSGVAAYQYSQRRCGRNGNIDAFGARSGGDISIAVPGRIVTGVINSSSQSGSAGSSQITGQKDVEVVSIKARGNTGGDVAIEAGGAFRAAGTGTAAERAQVSISTDGLAQSGSQTLLKALARREPARRRLLGRETRSRTLPPPQLRSGRWRSWRVRHQLPAWNCKLQTILNKL